MANQYKSFYLSDLKMMILKTFIDGMLSVKSLSDNTKSHRAMNERIAIYNDGLRDMAQNLIFALENEAEKDGDD